MPVEQFEKDPGRMGPNAYPADRDREVKEFHRDQSVLLTNLHNCGVGDANVNILASVIAEAERGDPLARQLVTDLPKADRDPAARSRCRAALEILVKDHLQGPPPPATGGSAVATKCASIEALLDSDSPDWNRIGALIVDAEWQREVGNSGQAKQLLAGLVDKVKNAIARFGGRRELRALESWLKQFTREE